MKVYLVIDSTSAGGKPKALTSKTPSIRFPSARTKQPSVYMPLWYFLKTKFPRKIKTFHINYRNSQLLKDLMEVILWDPQYRTCSWLNKLKLSVKITKNRHKDVILLLIEKPYQVQLYLPLCLNYSVKTLLVWASNREWN